MDSICSGRFQQAFRNSIQIWTREIKGITAPMRAGSGGSDVR